MPSQFLREGFGAALRRVLSIGESARSIPRPPERRWNELQIQQVLQNLEKGQGGIHKRIAEIREIAECIRVRHPKLLEDELGLRHWLSASDDFLCSLRDVAWPEGSSEFHDELRRRFEMHMPRPDYN